MGKSFVAVDRPPCLFAHALHLQTCTLVTPLVGQGVALFTRSDLTGEPFYMWCVLDGHIVVAWYTGLGRGLLHHWVRGLEACHLTYVVGNVGHAAWLVLMLGWGCGHFIWQTLGSSAGIDADVRKMDPSPWLNMPVCYRRFCPLPLALCLLGFCLLQVLVTFPCDFLFTKFCSPTLIHVMSFYSSLYAQTWFAESAGMTCFIPRPRGNCLTVALSMPGHRALQG